MESVELNRDLVSELRAMKEAGLEFHHCVNAFGEDASSAFVHAARDLHHRDGEVEIDIPTVVSRGGDDGAYVMGWIWVDNADVATDSSDAQTADAKKETQANFRNFYACPNCKYEWEDVWPAQCDDDCPQCGTRHISPVRSEDA